MAASDPLEHTEYQWRMARKRTADLAATMGMESDAERIAKAELAFRELFDAGVARERHITDIQAQLREAEAAACGTCGECLYWDVNEFNDDSGECYRGVMTFEEGTHRTFGCVLFAPKEGE
jgi:hypothetical protein